MSLLGLLLREAVADERLGFSPCQGVRILTRHPAERPTATAGQVNRIAERISRHSDQVLVITAAYTGMRWGELAGLAKKNTHLGDCLIRIHPEHGALHEVRGTLYLGPPKTTAAVRDIHLPPFLTELLQTVIDSHDHPLVFCGARGAFLRRSSMSRRAWRPAVNGDPATRTPPIIENLHLHDLRHTHKTWLIENDIPRSSPSPQTRPPPTRRPRRLQPRHPRHDRPHHQQPPSTLGSHPHRRQPPPPASRGLTAPHAHSGRAGAP
ncbi:tyrosine-type recombinase/integrase [Actinoplanes teichomyceticus]|uniref:Phage integrase family protein n=1 Tax=Actinoplanes teichomyceticus TaxID=1867 RepID=A0A561VIT4_ACTTI|nr:tyrosine-type recombinase/integrase [Actinoplanes teichomyceticus]TWG11519.1 phage integrase family protein [Actinoplanes teichomyceticus]GIF15965.1 hypothetical protein Ate01nite_59970 [Actinoplanes teichomyceticus]